MNFRDLQVPPPKSWEIFESLAQALFGAIWKDPLAKKHGRRGQPQHGVDVYGEPKGPGGPIYAVQCKGKDAGYRARATVKEFDAELSKAESFEPALEHWIFATTAEDDEKLQKHARLVSKERRAAGKFTVDVLGWGSLHAKLSEYPAVAREFYPDLFPRDIDVERLINEESRRALAVIDDTLRHGDVSLTLIRPELVASAVALLEERRLLRISGEGGAGKSGLLKRIGSRFHGTILAIADNRTTATSLQQHFSQLGIVGDPSALLSSITKERPGLLLVDGADRLLLSERRGVVVDALRIITGPDAGPWQIATTARRFQDRDLVVDALSEVGFAIEGAFIDVTMIGEGDVKPLSVAFPSFAPLLSRTDLSQRNRSLFLLRELLKIAEAPDLPLTELQLAAAWSGARLGDTGSSARRSKALSELGQRLVEDPWRRPAVAQFDPDGLRLLIEEGAVAILANQDAVGLTHDVHEDWLLARALHRLRENLPRALQRAGEPLWWLRSVRLLGQLLLESGEVDGWTSLLRDLDATPDIDPAWARAVLVAPLYSERADEILPTIEPRLLDNDAALLHRLIETLIVFETRIDDRILTSPELADLRESVRFSVAAHYKNPVLTSWAAFLRWSLPRWSEWPATLYPRLSEIGVLFARSLRNVQNWVSEAIAKTSLRWLEEIEDALTWDRWEDRREAFDTELEEHRGWEETAKRLRETLIHSIVSAPRTLEFYLKRLAQRDNLHAGREQLLASPGRVPELLPVAWTDMCLAHFVPRRPRIRYGPDDLIRPDYFSFHEMHDAGIKGDGRFFPASPLRGGFDQLFQADEAQGLRLFHGLEMRASVFYRWFVKCHDRRRAVPTVLKFPWGSYRLWGDTPVFKWSRGLLGSPVLGSAYLALDNWLNDQIAKGRSIEDLLRLVLRNNGLVSTAAPFIPLLAAQVNEGNAIDLAGPLLGEPRLWDYDIRLNIDDHGYAHRFSLSGRDQFFDAAERTYQRHAGRQPLHNALLLPFRLKAREAAQQAFDERRNAWTANDLAGFEDELADEGLVAERHRQIERFRSDGDPSQIEFERVEQGIQVRIAPPKESEADIALMEVQHQILARASRLANWVNTCREEWKVSDGLGIEDAISSAIALVEDLKSGPRDEYDLIGRFGAAGIVGTAAVAVNFGDSKLIEQHRDWIVQMLETGAKRQRSPEDDALTVDGAILSNDPQVYAAWGLAALVSHGPPDAALDRLFLQLVIQRLHAVTEAAIQGLKWSDRPDFVRGVHVAALDSCIIDVGRWWRESIERVKAAARTQKMRQKAIKRALLPGAGNGRPLLPPPAFKDEWVWTGKLPVPIRRLRMRSKRVLDWHRAEAVLKQIKWSELCDTSSLRDLYSSYLASLVEWTRGYSEQEEHRFDSNFPYEWGHALSRESGRFAASSGRHDQWLPLTRFTYHDRPEDLVGDYCDAVAHELMASGRRPDERFWTAWKPAAEWLMSRTIPTKRGRYDEVKQPLLAAGLVGPYLCPIPPDWPHLEDVLPWIDGWVRKTSHLPSAAYSALGIVERMSTDQRDRWFVPWLVLWTERAGTDGSYWTYYELGNKAATLLKGLPAKNPATRQTIRQCLSVMADAGAIVARSLLPGFAAARPNRGA